MPYKTKKNDEIIIGEQEQMIPGLEINREYRHVIETKMGQEKVTIQQVKKKEFKQNQMKMLLKLREVKRTRKKTAWQKGQIC